MTPPRPMVRMVYVEATAAAIASVTKLFNLSISCGCIPHDWKYSLVVPIPKEQGAHSPNELWPTSLLPIISKVIKRYFEFSIYYYLLTFIKVSIGISTLDIYCYSLQCIVGFNYFRRVKRLVQTFQHCPI